MINIINIIKFIGEKNSKYNFDSVKKFMPAVPVGDEGFMDENGKQGKWEGYYDVDNVMSYIGTFKNDKEDGYWEEYNIDGNISSKGEYKR